LSKITENCRKSPKIVAKLPKFTKNRQKSPKIAETAENRRKSTKIDEKRDHVIAAAWIYFYVHKQALIGMFTTHTAYPITNCFCYSEMNHFVYFSLKKLQLTSFVKNDRIQCIILTEWTIWRDSIPWHLTPNRACLDAMPVDQI
jgi:hypothetical protein